MATETPAQKDSGHITKTALVARGWTAGMIKTYLPEPHLKKPNPRYKCAAPMCLYDESVVMGIEETDAFRSMRDRKASSRAALSVASLRSAEKKRQALFAKIAALDIEIPNYESKDCLLEAACDSYNERNFSDASLDSDPAFLERITVNMLRHDCDDYESQIEELFGAVGRQAGYVALKTRVLDSIGSKYGYLRAECMRQIARLTSDSEM